MFKWPIYILIMLSVNIGCCKDSEGFLHRVLDFRTYILCSQHEIDKSLAAVYHPNKHSVGTTEI